MDWETYISIVITMLVLNAPFYIELGKIKTKVDIMWKFFERKVYKLENNNVSEVIKND